MMNLFFFVNRRPVDELSPEERDARTVFCMQLSQRIRARDLEEFFSSVGKVLIFLTYWNSNFLAHIKNILLACKHFLGQNSHPDLSNYLVHEILGLVLILQHGIHLIKWYFNLVREGWQLCHILSALEREEVFFMSKMMHWFIRLSCFTKKPWIYNLL